MTRLEIAVRMLLCFDLREPGAHESALSQAFDLAEAILKEETIRQTEDALEQAEVAATNAPVPSMATRFSLDGVPLDAPPQSKASMLSSPRRCRPCGLDWYGQDKRFQNACPQCGKAFTGDDAP